MKRPPSHTLLEYVRYVDLERAARCAVVRTRGGCVLRDLRRRLDVHDAGGAQLRDTWLRPRQLSLFPAATRLRVNEAIRSLFGNAKPQIGFIPILAPGFVDFL